MKTGKEKQKNIAKIMLVGLCFILGVTLLVFGGLDDGGVGVNSSSAESGGEGAEVELYKRELEERIAGICAEVSGAGRVHVMVSLDSGHIYRYVSDGDGEVLIVGSGSTRGAVIERVSEPQILGVGIVCEGGSDPVVKGKIISLVSTALSLGTNRIFVTS